MRNIVSDICYWRKRTLFFASSTLLTAVAVCCASSGFAQMQTANKLLISEVCSRNDSVLADENGNYKDWIELYNNTAESLNLEGYSLSDNPESTRGWVFPDVKMEPYAHILVFASGEDRAIAVGCYQSLVKANDTFNYATRPAGGFNEWIAPGYDDSQWQRGAGSFGYGYEKVATGIRPNPLKHAYNAEFNYLYLRKKFVVSNIGEINFLALGIDYDDAIIVYINGGQVMASDNALSFPQHVKRGLIKEDVAFIKEKSRIRNGKPLLYVPVQKKYLMEGENLLAVKVISIDTSSLFCRVSLIAGYGNTACDKESVSDPRKYFLHTNFKLNGDGESVFLFDDSGQMIDSMQFPELHRDHSYGRWCDTCSSSRIFLKPSPGLSNLKAKPNKGYVPAPSFSVSSGFYGSAQKVAITTALEGGIVRFTTDGSEPSSRSQQYVRPLIIDSTSVIRAKGFHPGYLDSETKTNIFFINERSRFPVVSIAIDPDLLWNPATGIFQDGTDLTSFLKFGANFWKETEMMAAVHYFDNEGRLGFEQNMGFKIAGFMGSRFNDCKSFKITARGAYGQKVNYKLFPDRGYQKSKSFILRNAGNDFAILRRDGELLYGVHFRDAFAHSLAKEMNMEYQASYPVLVFLNGAYWGIYYLTEPVNKQYVVNNFTVIKDEVNLLYNQGIYPGSVKTGSNADYKNLYDFIITHDISLSQNYEYVAERLDIANFIDYFLLRIFLGENDWPHTNDVMWNANNSKWRYILKDNDQTLNLGNSAMGSAAFNHLDTLLHGFPTVVHSDIFRQLLRNESFRKQFTSRFRELTKTVLSREHLEGKVREYVNLLRPEMPRHLKRWAETGMEQWEKNIEIVLQFIRERETYMKQHMVELEK